jgi:hypothetical protein
MTEPFDIEQAARLTHEARAVEGELTDVSEWGRKIDAEARDAQLTRDREARERVLAENRRLAELCDRRGLLWQSLADGLDSEDLDVVRTTAQAIRQSAEDEFRRRGEGWKL